MRLLLVVLSALALVACATTAPSQKLNVLIVDGVNNHDWRPTTVALTAILTDSERFTVDVATSPPRDATAEAWAAWRPRFADYDVVVSNFNGGHLADSLAWPANVQADFENYVRGGGGFVSVHAANNAFLGWTAYEEMVGLLWREPSFGPSVIFDESETPVIVPTGVGHGPGHGPRHDFEITVRDTAHPITRGFPQTWTHPAEQLTHGQHGPDAAIRSGVFTYLTYAWSKDVNEREPMDWVRAFGQGRVYVTMLGHTWVGEDNPNLRAPGFQILFQRGVEWAASGRVTIPAPRDFNAESEASAAP